MLFSRPPAISFDLLRSRSISLRGSQDVYLGERGHEYMDDDTTVIVIDLVPNGEPIVPKGCCAIL